MLLCPHRRGRADRPTNQPPMSANHLIAVDALHRAMRLLVRGFGSSEAEVNAVCDNLI